MNLDQLIEDEKSPVICECNHKTFISDWEKNLVKTIKELGHESYERSPTHYVKEAYKSIKCEVCGKHWCCAECAIEDDAIPGFLDQWTDFPRKRDKNITLVKCLLCK